MRLLLAAVILAATPVTAHADLFAAPFMGTKFGGSTSLFDLEFAAAKKKFSLGAALMNVDDRAIGYEVSFGYIPGYFEADDAPLPLVKTGSFAVDLTGSVLISPPPSFTRGGLRPYLAVGAGLVHTQADDLFDVLDQVRRTMPVASIGGGATGLLTSSVGVRFDYRFLRSFTTDDGSLANVGRRISYSRFSVGLFLRL